MFLSLWGCQLVSFSRTELTCCPKKKKEMLGSVLSGQHLDWTGLGLDFRGALLFSWEVRVPFDWSLE